MQTDLPFIARCYSSRYFSIADYEPEVSPIDLLPHLGIRWIRPEQTVVQKIITFIRMSL